jgi:hypothetical protein
VTGDLVARLRAYTNHNSRYGDLHPGICLEAADELERLRKEVSELRHDIDRHLTICSELATENERLRAAALRST